MIRTSLLLISITFLSLSAFSQLPKYFNEPFDDNSHNWPEIDNQYGFSEIKSGNYILRREDQRTYFHFCKHTYIDPSDDYYIETELTLMSGDTTSGYGLVWGREDFFNNYAFNINGQGEFRIYSYNHKKLIAHAPWTKCSARGLDKTNKLAIDKKGNLMRFFVNDEEVFKMEALPFFGSELGFEVRKKKAVKVNYIKVDHPAKPIVLASNSVTTSKKEQLGVKINSPFVELSPIISADGARLYFARSNHPRNQKPVDQFKIWFTEHDEQGSWKEAENIGAPINNNSMNWVISVTPDGNTLLVSGVYDSLGNHKKDGISFTHKTVDGWSLPEEVVVKGFYNKARFTSYCLSANQQVLLMGIEQADAIGGNDLYVSFRNSDGTFTKPQNMGTDLNTFANDFTPYLAADMQTLYFSSSGYPGYGGADIYVSTRLDTSWQKWSAPKNLGPAINTDDFDSYYSIPASGEYAYLVSYKDSYGSADIFRIKLDDSARPKPVMLVKGKVFDKKTNEPLGAVIQYNNLETKEVIGSARANPVTGEYSIVLPAGVIYSLYAQKEDHFPVSERVDLKDLFAYQEIEQNLYLAPLEKDVKFEIKNIFFEYNRADLRSDSHDELDRLAEILKDKENIHVEIGGHTDQKGDVAYNAGLSLKRAGSVKTYLISQGVMDEQLIAKGYGESQPIYSGTDDKKQALNRRVEFKILKD